mgnify:CR=1 FL=1
MSKKSLKVGAASILAIGAGVAAASVKTKEKKKKIGKGINS